MFEIIFQNFIFSSLIFFIVLLFLSFILKINSARKINFLNHWIAIFFLFLLFFSVKNLFSGNILDFWKFFHIWVLENYFLLIFWILWLAISSYSDFYFWEYLKHLKKWKTLNFYYIFLLIFIFSMLWVIISSEAVSFLIFWELMSISSYFLVVHEPEKDWVLTDWAWYFIITHIWMFFILMSFIPFISISNSTFFWDWWWLEMTSILASFSFFTALIWFWSKAWLFPVHIWLPKAHPIAPTNVSSLMSWFMVKLPVLMILKFLLVFFAFKVEFSWFVVTLIVASISAFIGIFYAIVQKNIKIMLAYSTIENIWIIFIWVSISILWMYVKNDLLIWLWLFASLYHTFNHAIFKWLLFLVAWWIIERTKTYDYTKLWWMIKFFPFLSVIFLIWSLSIAWIIPLNWFNSELITFVWLFKWIMFDWVAIKILLVFALLMLALTTVFSLIAFTKMFWITCLWNKRSDDINYEKIDSNWENFAYLLLVFSIIGLAIFPGFIFWIVSNILNKNYSWSLLVFWDLNLNYTPLNFILIFWLFLWLSFIFYKFLSKDEKKSNVWNCWYNYIEPRTQYSSDSFIQPLRRIFSDLYWEDKKLEKISKNIIENNHKNNSENNLYKKDLSEIKYSTEKKYFVENFYLKSFWIITFFAKQAKSLQNWQIHSYIFYIFLAIMLIFWIILIF